MLEVVLGGVGALLAVWIGFLTWKISVLDQELARGENELASLSENIDEIQGVILEKFEQMQEETQGFDWREMIEMQRANLFQNILGIGVQKLASKLGMGQIALANIEEPSPDSGQAWPEEKQNAEEVDAATI